MATKNIPTTEYALQSNSYTAFDAMSLRNLILQRLNEQNVFSDQNYIGSNLACVVDIISFAYNTLIFYLNRTSVESNFNEAQLQENINKIVKLLDYKPIGYQTSTLVVDVSASCKSATDATYNVSNDIAAQRTYTIPRYTFITVGSTPFSFANDVTFSGSEAGVVSLPDVGENTILYQGRFREYPTHTAEGSKNEIVEFSASYSKIDHFNIDVYVYEQLQQKWVQYKNTSSFFENTSTDRCFEKRLSPSGSYEITFGDGINGRLLRAGDLVSIYYLESNGEQGVVGPEDFSSVSISKFSGNNLVTILTSLNTERFGYLTDSQIRNLYFSSEVGSTEPREIESVSSIKKNAPANFRGQNRLVTKQDIETFVNVNFRNFVADAKVFSNLEFTTQYLKYFNDINIDPKYYRQLLLNHVSYADSCNFNNVYICGVPRVSTGSTLKFLLPAQKEAILSSIQPIKTLTSEVMFMDPIYKAVSFGTINNSEINVEERIFDFLYLIKNDRSNRPDKTIIEEAKIIFQTVFNPQTTNIGQKIDLNFLTNRLLSIDGIQSIQTKRIDTNETFDGLSLLVWNPSYPEQDKQIITTNTDTSPFDFIYFDNLANIESKIRIEQSRIFS